MLAGNNLRNRSPHLNELKFSRVTGDGRDFFCADHFLLDWRHPK